MRYVAVLYVLLVPALSLSESVLPGAMDTDGTVRYAVSIQGNVQVKKMDVPVDWAAYYNVSKLSSNVSNVKVHILGSFRAWPFLALFSNERDS